MNDTTATILASIDFTPAIAVVTAVGLGLVALAVLGFIFNHAQSSVSGDASADRDDEEDDR